MNTQTNSLQPSCRDCPLRPASSLRRPLESIYKKRPDNAELKMSVMDTTIMACVLFSDESECTTQSVSRQVFTWRETGVFFHPSYVRKQIWWQMNPSVWWHNVEVLSAHSGIGMSSWKISGCYGPGLHF
ncbi:hypothetical protein TNCV_3520271 [Trichonephila clavipes]|nr:hypothetical protein TNCV_3520271 [Trichonephila clavipes]